METAALKIDQENFTPQQIKTISNLYNYSKVLNILEKKGKERFGSSFTFLPQDLNIVIILAGYFLQDQQICDKFNIDMRKGIMLSGPIGCGKTSLMHLMKYIPNELKKFRFKSCREITFEFIKDGYDILHKYSRGDLYKSNTAAYCFDDLGSENNIKYFGNECNVMAEILLSRYDIFIANGLCTHITTNLSAQELEEIYGNRLRSRLRQMLNLISFNADSQDKRK